MTTEKIFVFTLLGTLFILLALVCIELARDLRTKLSSQDKLELRYIIFVKGGGVFLLANLIAFLVFFIGGTKEGFLWGNLLVLAAIGGSIKKMAVRRIVEISAKQRIAPSPENKEPT